MRNARMQIIKITTVERWEKWEMLAGVTEGHRAKLRNKAPDSRPLTMRN